MRRMILGWTLVGLAIPLLVLLIAQLQGGVSAWPWLAFMLWPAWILNAVTFDRESSFFGISVLAISICANGLLYAVIGIVWWGLCSKYSA